MFRQVHLTYSSLSIIKAIIICMHEVEVFWNDILQEDINYLIRSMTRRFNECATHRGPITHY